MDVEYLESNSKVFISYAHDTEQFSDKVLAFANKLRDEGIDASIDQYEESPPESWPRWMDKEIRNSDFVLVICTQTYLRKIYETENKTGKGVNWEISIVYQYIYDSYTNNTKFIPVLFEDASTDDVPTPLKGATFYFPDDPKGFEKLYNRLRGIKLTEKPPLGKLKPLPEKSRKKLFVTTVIDIELWNKANWKGVVFLFSNNQPPVLGILCENKIAIQGVFHGWIKTLKDYDYFRDMKISLIEGEVPGELSGYYVFITSDIDEFIKRIEKEEKTLGFSDEGLFLTTISRYNRMNPTSESRSLEFFKALYKEFGYCYLAPASFKDYSKPLDELNIKYDLDYKIKFNNIAFRHVDEINADEVESAVLPKFKDRFKK